MTTCTKHSDRDTLLSCSACDRAFCYACLVQGPVGSKCRDCTRGIPVGITSKERTAANITHAVKDRFLALKILMAFVLAANVANIVSSQSSSDGSLGFGRFASKMSLQAYLIQHGESWRLLTGSIINGSLITTVINAAVIWWLGHQIAPKVRHLQFLALTLAALATGATAAIATQPNSETFGGLALSGGFAATYGVLRKRNMIGRLSLGNARQYSFGLLFVGWTVYGALTSEAGGGVAFLAGGCACGLLAWILLDPLRQAMPHKAMLATAIALGVAGFTIAGAVSFSVASSRPPAKPVNPLDASNFSKLLEDRLREKQTPKDGEWVTITYWEDNTDVGDYQTYHVRCKPSPVARVVAPVASVDANRVCTWLTAHPNVLTTQETTTCTGVVTWRNTVVGTFNGKPVNAQFEGDLDGCGSPLSLEAQTVLSELG
jgi:membrane associated rhomboid family serine protease